jgi:UDPglucose--hexose-1-phosphate uridylyltransferase
MVYLKKDPNVIYILLFKNHGREAGASLDHPHSQLITLPIIPKRVKEEIDGGKEYYSFRERCVFCDIVKYETQKHKRIVVENQDFIAICPFASRFPFETWIIPKTHSIHFYDLQKNELRSFAESLQTVLHKIKVVLNDPPFNFMLHTAPCNAKPSELPHFHWHLEITPKLTNVAGFEWGTGFYINPMPPELAADFLRRESDSSSQNEPQTA